MELCIKNAKVVDWCGTFIGDVYIKNGIITEIGKDLEKNCNIINAKGLTLMPSFVDLHAHFRDPGLTYKEDIESGSKAAVKGGFTMVNLMANTNPVCSSMDTVNYVKDKAKETGLIDIHQVVSITRNFNGQDISHLDEIDNSIKVISEDGKDVVDSMVMLKAMKKAEEKDFTVMCHCEDPYLSNYDMRIAENIMTKRNIEFSKITNCKLHIAHVSALEAMSDIIEAKKQGLKVTCEVAPHHLALTNKYNYRVNPPLRDKEDIDFLIKAIKEGYVDAIATDHAPHSEEDKIKGAPGISGLETAFSIAYTKLVREKNISLNKLSEIMSKNPSELLGVNKGTIEIGYEGDLVLLDLEASYEINSREFWSKGKNTPLNGMKVYGKIVKTIKGGKEVYSNDEYN
ncbi:dihydroorotase, multifunctional complex type domain protein [Clostridium argentinense CDC 2741]|uniref:Dihydroorotase, multifunctional complex type domain protein n=1 Tax=Clostridium argentinense CDC 2741 TaxID=1418104 RepID=A0A0C1UDM1_9CLOT|nr:dihydroorotase [Clostridium argentinense]ARC83216.1 dihydroorotase [Clostridium argentinense]KIE45510.1 dihydroorotase, multifunctional complex type domain protein [Clostridium argentinense CDC 2741]NFF41521.1 dihydroorotase [Clostridium argentinense]NFP52197.1 dihydroorotase [Clostridium argentinense]NFP74581.1 dihydroorotase [Clostridium argentinense]